MYWNGNFTGRAENALEITRLALKRKPSALASATMLEAIEECGPSLARGVITALEINVEEIVAQADTIAGERSSSLPLRRFQATPATLGIISRRAGEEAAMAGNCDVGTEHLLLAILSVHNDPTTCALRAKGITQDAVRGTLRRLRMSWTDDGSPRPRASVA